MKTAEEHICDVLKIQKKTVKQTNQTVSDAQRGEYCAIAGHLHTRVLKNNTSNTVQLFLQARSEGVIKVIKLCEKVNASALRLNSRRYEESSVLR